MKVLITIIFSLILTGLQAQVVPAEKQRVLKVSLYRGIVEIEEISGNDIRLEHITYSYDSLDRSGTLVPMKSTSTGKLQLATTKDSVLVTNDTSRELQYLKISMPSHLTAIVDINHYGEVRVKKASEPIEVKVFNGKIEIEEALKSVSATVVRHGDIQLFSRLSKTAGTIALSTYEGDISFSSSIQNANYIIKSDLGEIVNNIGLKLKKDRPVTFEVTENGERRRQESFWYKGKMGSGKGASIMLLNTYGRIVLSGLD